jgi:rhomboid-like protein
VRRTETWAGAVAATTASVAQSTSKKRVLDILPSLGASGAIYAAVTMTALAFPDSEVALFIPPSYPINIQYGVGALMALDTIGIIRGWRFVSCFVFFFLFPPIRRPAHVFPV